MFAKLRLVYENTKVKISVTFFGIFFVFFGAIALLITDSSIGTRGVGWRSNPLPMREVNMIAVDSLGNIHYDNSEFNSIQVYNNEGSFLYRIAIPFGINRSSIIFFVDENDVVHATTRNINRIYFFKDGLYIDQRRFENEEDREAIIDEILNQRRMGHFDYEGNRYVLSRSNFSSTVSMFDQDGNLIRSITPNAPIWPFPFYIGRLFVILGLLMFVVPNIKFICELYKSLPPKGRW